jgi:ABC-type multidrug transport system fused ATPase/permease subunit
MKRPKYSNLEFIRDLWHFLKIHKGKFIFWTILLVIANTPVLITPIIIALIIDFFVIGSQPVSLFYTYLGILLGMGILGTFLRHYAKYYMILYTHKVQKHAKVESFQKVLQGDLVWHDKETTGEKMQKIAEGERIFADFLNLYINKGIGMALIFIGVIGVFAYFNLKYALLALLFMAIYLFFEVKLNKKVAEKTLQLKIAKERASGKAYEFSSNIGTIKALGIEGSSGRQIISQEERVLIAKKEKRKASTFKWVVVQLISVIFFALFIFLVGKDILIGVLSVGSIVIYLDYIRRLRENLNTLSVEANHLIDIKYGLFRLMEIYRAIPETDEEGARNLKNWEKLRVEDLGFNYRKEGVLENFSLDINKGERIGVVGKSGSGKSTLFKLLLKLYLPKSGMIYFDKDPITKLKRDSILKKISVVPQETELFNLSLRENITISGGGRIDLDRYKKALKISQADKIVNKLSRGDLTIVGEKGVRLSGGERQRIGIARAIYKNSEILILDEATSNLDYETEKKILEAIDENLEDKTLIFSAHRLQTLKAMDRIVVVEKGKITEEGDYKELLKNKGRFYRLLKSQKV